MFKFLLLLLCLQFSNDNISIQEKLNNAINLEKPILIIFSAKWCIPCELMKKNTIEPMIKSGELDSVTLIHIDVDKEKDFTKKYIGENFTIPKTILFFQEDEKWFKIQLTGLLSREKILEVLELQKKRKK